MILELGDPSHTWFHRWQVRPWKLDVRGLLTPGSSPGLFPVAGPGWNASRLPEPSSDQ
jgi:hypothetical protein